MLSNGVEIQRNKDKMTNELVIVTASVNPEKTLDFWSTWRGETNNTPLVLVVSGKGKDPEELGAKWLKHEMVN